MDFGYYIFAFYIFILLIIFMVVFFVTISWGRKKAQKVFVKNESKLLALYQSSEEMVEQLDSTTMKRKEEFEKEKMALKELIGMVEQMLNVTTENLIKIERKPQTFSLSPEKIDPVNLNPAINSSKEKYQRVSQLYTQAFDLEEISRQLGIPKGEVHLIVDLINKKT